MRRHGRARRIGEMSRYDRNDLALIGEIERIEAKDFAKAFDFFSQRGSALFDLDSNAGGFGNFVEHGCDAAARRIANELHLRAGVDEGVDERVQCSAIAFDRCVETEIPARSENGRTMIAEKSIDQNHIARFGAVRPKVKG